jgi:16S rRNA (guanine527-N7)-methyltransferase
MVAGARHFGLDPQEAVFDRLDRFITLLETWNRRIRLTGERERGVIVGKHVVDCLAVVPELPRAGTVIDVGSGAGFPGIILACVRPDLDVVLLDSRRKVTSFLRDAVRQVPLPAARVIEARADDASHDASLAGRAAVVTTRAVRLEVFLAAAAPLLDASGEAIAMQTPRTARNAVAEPVGHRLRLQRRREYTLPDGARRTLLVFRRTDFAVS